MSGPDWERLRGDLERTDARHVHMTGAMEDPVPLQHLADVFVLTSHEDPFPLVCLEQAALGHPVVTFRNGGIVDLLQEAGPEAALGVVDHLDMDAMVDRLTALIYVESLRATAGAQLHRRVTEAYDVSVAAPPLVEDLRRVAGLPRLHGRPALDGGTA